MVLHIQLWFWSWNLRRLLTSHPHKNSHLPTDSTGDSSLPAIRNSIFGHSSQFLKVIEPTPSDSWFLSIWVISSSTGFGISVFVSRPWFRYKIRVTFLGLSLVGYLRSPPLYWHVVEGLAVVRRFELGSENEVGEMKIQVSECGYPSPDRWFPFVPTNQQPSSTNACEHVCLSIQRERDNLIKRLLEPALLASSTAKLAFRKASIHHHHHHLLLKLHIRGNDDRLFDPSSKVG